MWIWGLDLGVRTGFAYGLPGEPPCAGVCTLKKRGEPQEVAFANLLVWLAGEFRKHKPDLVAAERALPLGAFHRLQMSEEVVSAHHGYHAILRALCHRSGARYVAADPSTVRKYFIGEPHKKNRESTKDAVVLRCHDLGMMPRDKWDHDQGDALAVWDWAGAFFARRSIGMMKFGLFEPRAVVPVHT